MCTVNLLEKDLLFPLSLWLQNESFSRSRSRTSFCETCWRKYWPVEVSKAIFRVDIRRALSQKEKNTVVFDGLPVSFPQPSSTFCGFFSYQQSLLIKKKKSQSADMCIGIYIWQEPSGFLTYFGFPFDP